MNSLKFLILSILFVSLSNVGTQAQTLPPEVVDAKPKMYRILGGRKNGTKFRHVEAEFPIPFDRSYSELKDNHRDIYRKIYTWLTETRLTSDQTPPYPKKGLSSLYKPIIKKNKLVAINKTVFFIADVKEDGEVDKVKIYSSPNREFNEFITALMFSTEFEPGTCAGEPCAMEFPFEIDLRYVNRNSNITGNVGSDSWASDQPR